MKTKLLAFLLLFSSVSSDIFCQNRRVDGYKGLWFSAGQVQEYGYRFSGGVATFNSQNRPIAIYSPEVKKTFFLFGGTTTTDDSHLLIMISYFDHKVNMVPKPVIVYDKNGVREPHDNASLSIDKDGYLWVFISGRNRTRPGMIFKSSKPYSIDSFEKISELEMISPQPWWIEDGRFMLIYSKVLKGQELYYSSGTDGKTWSESQKLASMGGHFYVSHTFGKKLVTVFNYHPKGNIYKRTNLYLLQTEDYGKTWETAANKVVKTPVTDINSEALIRNYEKEGKLVYINDLNFDKYGNPVLLVILSEDFNPGPNSESREWMIINWKDQKWNFHKVCESTHNYDMGSLYIKDNEWRIIGPTEPGPQKYGTGGEIALWISRDEGVNWEKVIDLTANSLYNNSFVRRPENSQKDFYVFWTDGDADKLSRSRLFFSNEECNKVWVLPYDMKKEFERPQRIR